MIVEEVTLAAGPKPHGGPLTFRTSPVVVFVGPNNSGKSKLLSEIHEHCVNGRRVEGTVVLKGIKLGAISDENLQNTVSRMTVTVKQAVAPDHVALGPIDDPTVLPRTRVHQILQRPNEFAQDFANLYLRYNALILSGATRIGLVNQVGAGDLQRPATHGLQALFQADDKRKELRRITYEAFGRYLVIDPTNTGSLRVRLSKREPASEIEERGYHKEAISFHAAATPIEEFSDGVKAFCGIMAQVIGGDPKVISVDEPEAFLHPALAEKLGFELARAAGAAKKNVFVSTHSPSFLMGCIQSGAPVTIIRLTYNGEEATARVLPSSELIPLMRNPLLRSTGVLSGLFYDSVVISEGDADRAFYQEMNQRMLADEASQGISSSLFLNAQNKQTIQTVMGPLRSLGIPAAGIVDVDVLKEGGTVFSSLLSAANIPAITQDSLCNARAALHRVLVATGKDFKRHGGIALLSGEDLEAAQQFCAQLREYGIFVVENGELESWLKEQGISGHGPTWLVRMFEAIGEEPSAEGYVRPCGDDVWAFLAGIRAWVFNPDRRGMPL